MLYLSYMLRSATPTATAGDYPLVGDLPLLGDCEKRPLLIRPFTVLRYRLPGIVGTGNVDILCY